MNKTGECTKLTDAFSDIRLISKPLEDMLQQIVVPGAWYRSRLYLASDYHSNDLLSDVHAGTCSSTPTDLVCVNFSIFVLKQLI